VALVAFLPSTNALSQASTDSVGSDRSNAVRVFLDCQRCDIEHIKSEITFVNYVRDRHDAQTHILITTQRTGSGGAEYTLAFIGQQEFAGKDDTLKFVTKESDTEETIRSEILRVLKLGLMRYVARTDLAQHISITYKGESKDQQVVDPWNYWVFKTSIRSYLNGEKSHSSISLYGTISANRVTQDMKLRLSAWGNYNEANFDIEDGTIKSISRGKGIETFIIASMNDHWSAGGEAEISTSTYSNRKLSLSTGPAIEYDIFPYSESTRRQLRIAYLLSYQYRRYEEETIFDKLHEHLVQGQLSVTLELKQTWGSVVTRLEESHYIHDFSKNRVELSLETSLRLVQGLSVDIFGNVSMIHDQLSLTKSGASTEEILLQQRQLATQYQYYTSIGLSYTFGSIYNNVVNPRFGNF
jgi:hypothetical protein